MRAVRGGVTMGQSGAGTIRVWMKSTQGSPLVAQTGPKHPDMEQSAASVQQRLVVSGGAPSGVLPAAVRGVVDVEFTLFGLQSWGWHLRAQEHPEYVCTALAPAEANIRAGHTRRGRNTTRAERFCRMNRINRNSRICRRRRWIEKCGTTTTGWRSRSREAETYLMRAPSTRKRCV